MRFLSRGGLNAVKIMLTIAGFDPSCGAGVAADLAVFAAHGCFGTACATMLTVQTTLGVDSVHPIAPEIVRSTLAALRADLRPDGIKIGALATAANVWAVADFLRDLEGSGAAAAIVLDPVLRSSSGMPLLSGEGVRAMREELLPRVGWVTPNLAELGLLVDQEITCAADMETGARTLQHRYPQLCVVVTGGHLDLPDDLVVPADGSATWMRGVRVASRSTHGTGCAFSSALACGLARGETGEAAARSAKRYVTEAIRRAVPLGGGAGPMNLLWPLHGMPGAR